MVSRHAHAKLAAQVALLEEIVDLLKLTNERQPAAPPPICWVALKAALPPGVSYEAARSWCERGFVRAQKQGGRWLVDPESLRGVIASRMRGAA